MRAPIRSIASGRRAPRPTISKSHADRPSTRHGPALPAGTAAAASTSPQLQGEPESTRYWLFKSEPGSRIVKGHDVKFSIDDLEAMPNQTTSWEGVRNYQARNLMRDDMKFGDLGLFYHSSCSDPAIVAIVKVVRESHPDPTSWNKSSPYYDPKSTPESPRWFMVDIQLVERLQHPIYLRQLKQYRDQFQDLPLLSKGSRLSVQRVPPKHWNSILTLNNQPE